MGLPKWRSHGLRPALLYYWFLRVLSSSLCWNLDIPFPFVIAVAPADVGASAGHTTTETHLRGQKMESCVSNTPILRIQRVSFGRMGITRSSTRLDKNHSAAHEASVVMSPLGVERQGDHPRVHPRFSPIWGGIRRYATEAEGCVD